MASAQRSHNSVSVTLLQLLAGLLAVTVTLASATQWVAGWLREIYGAGVLAPDIWLSLGEWPIYRPWLVFVWWWRFGHDVPHLFDTAGQIAAAGGISAGLAILLIRTVARAQPAPATSHGTARWAATAEIRRAGLFANRGVCLGRRNGKTLRYDGAGHVLAFAPTRSGKGVGLVIPTLLTWPGSVVVHDLKHENWQVTAGYRSRMSRCHLFDPTCADSARYNPLLEVRKGENEVRDVQNIADILVDPEGARERRSHWDKTSHALLVGMILHVLYGEADKTLARVVSLLSDPDCSFEQTLRRMMATNHIGTPQAPAPHPVVAAAARDMLNKAENERSGVLSTALSQLEIYRDPKAARATSACDFKIADLMQPGQPVSLYIGLPASDKSRCRPLIRMLFNQIMCRLTETAPPRGSQPMLLMLDEFPALGRLDFFESNLAYMAGYGIRAYIIAQSLNQLSGLYGEHSAIMDNCHVRITFASNDDRTALRISQALGTATQERLHQSFSGASHHPQLSHLSQSLQHNARPLLTTGEVMQLPPHQAILLVSGLAPVLAEKLTYYRDGFFRARLLPPPWQPGCPDTAGRDDGRGAITGPASPGRDGTGRDGTGSEGAGFEGTGFEGTGFEDTGFEDTGLEQSGLDHTSCDAARAVPCMAASRGTAPRQDRETPRNAGRDTRHATGQDMSRDTPLRTASTAMAAPPRTWPPPWPRHSVGWLAEDGVSVPAPQPPDPTDPAVRSAPAAWHEDDMGGLL